MAIAAPAPLRRRNAAVATTKSSTLELDRVLPRRCAPRTAGHASSARSIEFAAQATHSCNIPWHG
eukprot:9491530-Pyramimonas_sp.AAC.1